MIAVAAAALILMLGVANVALAHDEHGTELKGTIKSLTAEKLEVTATDGDVVEFMVAEGTKFIRGTTVVKREDVVIGERAIVEYHEMGEIKHALEVKLGAKKP
jgi:hypothetical protein